MINSEYLPKFVRRNNAASTCPHLEIPANLAGHEIICSSPLEIAFSPVFFHLLHACTRRRLLIRNETAIDQRQEMQPNYAYISFFYGIWIRGRFSLNDTHSLSRYASRNVAPVYAGDSVLVSPRQSNHPVEPSYRLSPSLPTPFEASFVRRPVSFLALLFPPSHRSLASACSVISTIHKFNLSGFEERWLRRITIREK